MPTIDLLDDTVERRADTRVPSSAGLRLPGLPEELGQGRHGGPLRVGCGSLNLIAQRSGFGATSPLAAVSAKAGIHPTEPLPTGLPNGKCCSNSASSAKGTVAVRRTKRAPFRLAFCVLITGTDLETLGIAG